MQTTLRHIFERGNKSGRKNKHANYIKAHLRKKLGIHRATYNYARTLRTNNIKERKQGAISQVPWSSGQDIGL